MKKTSGLPYEKVLTGIYHILYDAFGPQHWWPGETPFEVVVGAILTQNTNWGNVEKAINNLKRKGVLTARALHTLPDKKLASLIRPAGYYNIKTRRLKNFLDFFANHYKGRMKAMKSEDEGSVRTQLLSISGIGPETADSILLYALEKPVFVVDAYTKRVLSRHGLVTEKASYQETQELFHTYLFRDTRLYNEYHALFVKVGKEFCSKGRPKCSPCPLQPLFAGPQLRRER